MGHPRRALEELNGLIEVAPDFARAYLDRGIIHARDFKEFRRAIQDFDRAVQLQPYRAEAYYSRGTAYDRLNVPDRACRDWLKACLLGYGPVCQYLNSTRAC